jgi:hypothetical protein
MFSVASSEVLFASPKQLSRSGSILIPPTFFCSPTRVAVMCRNAVCIARSAPTWLRTALLSHVQPVNDGYSGSLGLAKQPRSGEKHG